MKKEMKWKKKRKKKMKMENIVNLINNNIEN